MTNNATVLNRDITRFLKNKVKFEQISNSMALILCLGKYLSQLYPEAIYCHKEKPLLIYYKGRETIVFSFILDTCKSIEENKFWEGLYNTQNTIRDYKNVDESFLYFITNNNMLWTTNIGEKSREDDYTLKGTAYRRLTLYPLTKHMINGQEKEIWPCQMVWLPTRETEYRCCVATFDKDIQQHDYRPHTKSPMSANDFHVNEKDYNAMGAIEIPQLDIDLTPEAKKFYQMMHEGRFVEASSQLFEWENSFANDYSRIVMSPAFRRLKDKTQVFSLEDSDFVRVRLTHSIEVANVCRLIGRGLELKLSEKVKGIENLKIPDVVEVAGLIHDIGNPPFGHFGEKTIQNFFKDVDNMPREIKRHFLNLEKQQIADLQNFDGNVQGFRILRHLGLASDCTSFNLNKVILSTLVKYPYNSVEGNDKRSHDHRKSKFGYFQAEDLAYSELKRTLGLQEHQRHPLTYILEAADDIVYKGDDIEDGWKLKYISLNDYIAEFDRISSEQFLRIFGEDWTYFKGRLLDEDSVVVEHTMLLMRIRMQRYMIRKFIDVFVDKFEDIVNNKLKENEQELLLLDEDSRLLHTIWGHLVQYCYNGIHRTQLQGARILENLLSIFLEAIFSKRLSGFEPVSIDENKKVSLKRMVYKIDTNTRDGMLYEIISNNYRNELSSLGRSIPQDDYSKFLLVVDFISGMTDQYAYNLYYDLKLK